MPKPKDQQFTVTITAYASIVVTAATEEEARERAQEVISKGDFEVDEMTAKLIQKEVLNSVLRHADAVDYDLEEAQEFARRNPFKAIPRNLLNRA